MSTHAHRGHNYVPGDNFDLTAQGMKKESKVLAVINHQLLVEYQSSEGKAAGTTTLRILTMPGPVSTRVYYPSVPLKWLRAIVYEGTNSWIGKPVNHAQDLTSDEIKTPGYFLGIRTGGEEPCFNVELEKAYVNDDDRMTLRGYIPILAGSESVAKEIVRMQMSRDSEWVLQTCDRHIRWDKPIPEGMEYEDFSFKLSGQIITPECLESFPHDHSN